MKRIITIVFLPILLGCKDNPETLLSHLNGYWEIEKVSLPDGTNREYAFNETIDFLSISDDMSGFRKKVKPNFDGTFSTSGDDEKLKVMIENDRLNMYYKTPYAEWKETVLKATESTLIVENQNKIRYTYKRYVPFSIE